MKKTITFFKTRIGSTSSLHFDFKWGLSSLRIFAFVVAFLGFTANSAWGQTTVNYAMSSMGLANTTPVGTSVRNTTDGKITFTFAQNSSTTAPTYYTSGTAVRLYQNATKGGSIKIMVASGYKITSATVTKASGDGDGPVGYAVDGGTEAGSFTDGTTSNTTGTINATSSVEFYSKGSSSTTRFYVVSFSVTYEATTPPAASTPTFSPAAGTYTSAQNVSLSSTTSGAKIYYTTNGTDPSSSSTLYSSPISVSTSTTIKAIAYDSNDANPSSIATAAYTINASSPTITVTGTLNAFANTVMNATSAEQSYTVLGANLTDNIIITPPAGFEISKSSGSGFVANPSTLTFTSGEIASAQNVYVRFAPTAAQAYSGNIAHTSTGATQVNKAVSGTGVNAEPTNQPTGLTATTNSSSQITVTWTDATGGQVPASYLVIASTGTPTTPVDGTAQADGTQLNGEIVKNITQITQTAVFTGLNASTIYNFSIWPYTNSGAAIDYKTDGTIATASATTETPLGVPVATAATDISATGFTANWNAAASATGYDVNVYTKTAGANASDLFISEYIDGSSGTNKAIEIYNGTGSAIDLSNYKLWIISNGGSWPETTINLSGTLLNNDVFVISNGTDFLNLTNSSDLTSTSLSFNGDDAVGLAKNIASTWTLIDAIGVDGTDPGTGWNVADVTNATADHVLIRKSSIVSPNTNWDNSRGTSSENSEWIVGSGGANTDASGFGSHTMAGGSSITPISGSPFAVSSVTSKAVSGLNPGTEYFYTVVAKNATGSSAASNEISVTTTNSIVVNGDVSASTLADCATCNVTVADGGHLTVDAVKTYNSITVAPQGKLTNSSTLTVSAITIQSDANGTGTILGNVSGAATVNQHLSSYRTWYLSSPVSNVAPSNMDRYKFYDETTGNWSTTAPAQTIGAGFLAVPTNNAVTSTSFTGTLNSGNVSIDVTRTVANGAKPGFNLVGNPYPSYLDWSEVNTANSSLMPTSTMWYRTKKRNQSDELVYQFWTVNGNGVGSPSAASQYIPPMQAFWVRAKASGQFQLTNDMCSHAVGEDYLLKAPTANRRTLIRLELSNGTNTDETVLYLSDNANNGLDAFDAPKMSNEDASIAEIFTRAGNEKLVINALQTLPKDTEIALGFEAGSGTSFTLRANELSNLPTDVKLILKDNVTKAETDLTDGTAVYSFGDIATSGDRFSIIFRTAGAITGIDQPTFSGLTAYSNANNQLTVLYDGAIDAHTVVSVYNAVGQRLVTQSLTGVSTVIDSEFAPGIYVVKVNNLSRKLTIKN